MDNPHRQEYARRMHRVLEHIDRHLGRQVPLPELAGVAHFSPFHFHRLFSAWMGETLGDYVRRRRVETAASRLLSQPALTVLEAALSVGFGSAEAFTRAFRQRFGAAPSVWRAAPRRDSNFGQMDRNSGQAVAPAGGHDGASRTTEDNMEVTLIDRQPVTLAYLRKTGPYGPEINEFWQRTMVPWMMTNGLMGLPRYGISLDDPDATAPEHCRYDAAVEVPEDRPLSGNALRTVLPGGRYAVHRFRGTGPEVAAAWRALTRDWLPGRGLQLDARPFFEYYPPDAQYDPATGVFEAHLHVPVAPL
jgi:AraC family transcriptional regulator